MVGFRHSLFSLPVIVASISISSTAFAAPVGVDGTYGAEWNGVTPKSIAAAPYNQAGVGVAYDVYARADANYFYTLVVANPAGEGQDNWTSTIAAQLGNVVNLNFDMNPSAPEGGSEVIVETSNNRYATFTNDSENPVLYNSYNALNGFVQASTTVRSYSDANPGYSVELAIPWAFFETDPDNTGNMPVLTADNPDLILRGSTSFDGTFTLQGPQYGTQRFGLFTDPNVVPEPTALAMLGLGGIALLRRRRRA